MALRNLNHKQVLITGGSASIGYETALAFARRGANIILANINVLAEINAQGGFGTAEMAKSAPRMPSSVETGRRPSRLRYSTAETTRGVKMREFP
jgi:NAD(P)-dependent dehydrogenase (short-subunit alcohol dehydrogenase family)